MGCIIGNTDFGFCIIDDLRITHGLTNMWIITTRFQLIITNLIFACFLITTILDYVEHFCSVILSYQRKMRDPLKKLNP